MSVIKRLDFWIGTALASALIAGSWLKWLPLEMTETLGFVTGATCVYLAVKENIWNFPVGLANNISFLVLFLGTRLYGDAGLQIVYIALGLQGWYVWLYGGQNRTALRVAHTSRRTLVTIGVLIILGTLGMMSVLRHVKDSSPVLDGLTTVLSLVAQYLFNRKVVENWYVWIAADVIYIYLYVSRGLHLTAILYFIFMCLCVAGLQSWRRSLVQRAVEDESISRGRHAGDITVASVPVSNFVEGVMRD